MDLIVPSAQNRVKVTQVEKGEIPPTLLSERGLRAPPGGRGRASASLINI
jgi:hypothetical protein